TRSSALAPCSRPPTTCRPTSNGSVPGIAPGRASTTGRPKRPFLRQDRAPVARPLARARSWPDWHTPCVMNGAECHGFHVAFTTFQGPSMHILITGGAGFIGSHLVDLHLACGDQVHVVDDLSTGVRANLAAHEQNP